MSKTSKRNMIFLALLLVFLVQTSTQKPYSLKSLLDAINKARTDPQGFKKFIKSEWYDDLDTKFGQCSVSRWRLPMVEKCPTQFNSLFEFYEKQKPLPAMKLSQGLTAGAYNHAKYLGTELHKMSHFRPGENIKDRYTVYTKQSIGAGGENIIRFNDKSTIWKAAHIIARWVIDDGTPKRGHRANIYGENLNYVGLGIHEDSKSKGSYFLVLGVANRHDCSECSKIPAAINKAMGWDEYINPPKKESKEESKKGEETKKEGDTKKGGDTKKKFDPSKPEEEEPEDGKNSTKKSLQFGFSLSLAIILMIVNISLF